MQFLNPIALWGFAGLLVPVGIHLLSRKEGKVIRIGSLRHLGETNTKQFRSIRLNEILLLVLRCLLIAWIVLLMAGTQIDWTSGKQKRWALIEKGIEERQDVQPLLDSLASAGFEIRYLAHDFPLLKDSSAVQNSNDYWGLVEKLRTTNTGEVVVISFTYASQFRGERLSLPDGVRWITVSPRPAGFIHEAVMVTADSVYTRIAHSNEWATKFETRIVAARSDQSPVTSIKSITVALVNDPAFEYDAKVLKAALSAIQSITPHKLTMRTSAAKDWNDTTRYDWLIWLGENVPPVKTGKSIVYRSCLTGTVPALSPASDVASLCRDTGEYTWIITRHLHEEIMLTENVTATLATILLANDSSKDHKQDKRVLAEAMMWSRIGSATVRSSHTTMSLDQYLAILMLLTLATERWISHKRNQ